MADGVRAVRKGDYLSTLVVYGDSANAADQLAKRLEAVVARKFAKAGVG